MPPIFIALLLIASLLLWFVIGARGKWWIKLPMIVIVPVFMFVVWASLQSYRGWPTTNSIPNKALYVYGYVIEPDLNTGIKGAIYVWLIPFVTKHGSLDYAPKAGEPRAYKLPYSQGLEQRVMNANKAVGRGQQVGIKKSSGKTNGYASNHMTKSGYKFYNLRPAELPRKSRG